MLNKDNVKVKVRQQVNSYQLNTLRVGTPFIHNQMIGVYIGEERVWWANFSVTGEFGYTGSLSGLVRVSVPNSLEITGDI